MTHSAMVAFRKPVYSDAAKRCSDVVNLAMHCGDWGKWVAIRLLDGGSDGVVYDTRQDAIRHQFYEFFCCYVMVPPSGMQPPEAEEFMAFNRELYDAGFRMTDPEVVKPLRTEDVAVARRRLAVAKRR